MIGGPPHSGKSVLTYLLSQHLRQRQVAHYVLRACPDGEGDWSQETHPETVRLLRQKGAFSTEFVDRVCRDIAQRHLPLLVDVGGRPTPDQERIFRHCTHAILLSATPEGLTEWHDFAERAGVSVIARLQSVLNGDDRIEAERPVLRGQIGGLERYTGTGGLMVEALVRRLERLMSFAADELRNRLFPLAPTEMVVDLDQLAQNIGMTPGARWQATDLTKALTYLPSTALSIYGRGPNWLYVALALYAAPHPITLFDPRLGWISPAKAECSPQPSMTMLTWQLRPQPAATWLEFKSLHSYLDYETMPSLEIPALASDQGVIISGKLPHWLMTGLALAYDHHPWVAVMQAQQYDRAIVVASRLNSYALGQEIPLVIGNE